MPVGSEPQLSRVFILLSRASCFAALNVSTSAIAAFFVKFSFAVPRDGSLQPLSDCHANTVTHRELSTQFNESGTLTTRLNMML